jgi:hypothetical protein
LSHFFPKIREKEVILAAWQQLLGMAGFVPGAGQSKDYHASPHLSSVFRGGNLRNGPPWQRDLNRRIQLNTNRIAAGAGGKTGFRQDCGRRGPCVAGLEIHYGGFGMSDPSLDIARLSTRISALEKANRRWRLGGMALFILLVAAALLTGYRAYAQRSAPHPVPKAVAAREFVLMGPQGRVMGRIAVINGKPALQFYDSAGQLWWYAPPKMGVVPVKIK